jgi:hypothetical protein
MFKISITLAALITTVSIASAPALAGKGGGGGGQNASSNHTSTGAPSGKQTPANKVILHVRKAGGAHVEFLH